MNKDQDNVLRIRREIDLDDPRTLSFFGTSPQRRLSRLARDIAAQDSASIIEETDTVLSDALALLNHKPTRWLDPFMRVLAIIPMKTPEQRYVEITRRLEQTLSRLQRMNAAFNEWRDGLEAIQSDLQRHLDASKIALQERSEHPNAPLLIARQHDLDSSSAIAKLVSGSLSQRQSNYLLLTDQLNAVLGPGAAAWHVQRAGLRMTGQTGFHKLRDLAEACQTSDKTWQETIPDPHNLPE